MKTTFEHLADELDFKMKNEGSVMRRMRIAKALEQAAFEGGKKAVTVRPRGWADPNGVTAKVVDGDGYGEKNFKSQAEFEAWLLTKVRA